MKQIVSFLFCLLCIFAEVEFDSLEEANAFIPPAWFDKDVTDDPSYANSNISKRK